MNPTEYLSNDILQEDFVRVFSPFLRFQWLLGSCRVDARDLFVTPPTFYQKLYTILITTFVSLFPILTIPLYHYIISASDALTIFMTSLFWAQFVCNIIHVRFFNNESNVILYIKMQEIDRLMRTDVNKQKNSNTFETTYWTFIIIMALISVLFTFIFVCTVSGKYPYSYMISYCAIIFPNVSFIVEICYCSHLIVYFFLRVRYINSIIATHIEHVQIETEDNNFKIPQNNLINQPAASPLDLSSIETNIHLRKIFECFNIFQKLYNFQVTF